jgi:hypothetical protein
MRLILLLFLFSLQLSAQRFSKTDSTFGGANRPALLFVDNDMVIADEDQDSLGLLQIGLFDSTGVKTFYKSYDYYESPDSVRRVSPCFKCLKANRGSYFLAQTDFIRNDSAFVRFTKFNYNLDTLGTTKHLEYQGGTPEVHDFVFDTDSTFIVTGLLFRHTNYNKYDCWVAKFDTAFNPIWELRIPDTIPGMNGGYYGDDLVIDQYGSCLVTGRTNHYVPTQSNSDHSFAARIDLQTGALKWFYSFNQDLGSQNIAALDNGGGTYSFARMEVLSFIPNTYYPDHTRLHFGQLDTSGQVIADTTTGPKFPYFRFQDLIATSDGNYYVAGDVQVRPGKFPITAYKFTPQGDSIWMRSYYHLNDSADRNHIWAFQEAPDSGFLHLGRLIDVDNDIDSVRTLHFYMLKTDSYGCLQKGCQSIGLEEISPLEAELRVYPNPTTGVLHLESDLEQEIKYVLYNSLGQAIREGSFKASKTLNIRDLNQGVYVLQTRSGGRNYRSQKIWLQY